MNRDGPPEYPAFPASYHDEVMLELGRSRSEPPVIEAELVEEVRPPVRRRRIGLPVALFLATCLSTYLVGGWQYSLALMTILACHEAGHFIQAWRYRIPASLPFFIPVPLPPIGTLGAVIAMSSRIANRRALFDIGISGPLAGLVPTLIFCVIGLFNAEIGPRTYVVAGNEFGEPILFQALTRLIHGPVPDGYTVYIGAMGFAGWVGLLITSLNLFPIGQLDGGHILYGLLRKRAHLVAKVLLVGALAAVLLLGYYWWMLMLLLITFMGPKHPPTANDNMPLGAFRTVLGWLTLAFLPLGFTPNPFVQPTGGLMSYFRF
jgi:Zn-dependent protease